MPIIEEWTAWFLVRERERLLHRREQLREAERAREADRRANVRRLRPAPRRSAGRDTRRRAA